MCGVTAIFSPRRPVDPRIVSRGLESLRHRGPDAQRVWSTPDRTLSLGHARLSIIDLETGDQPISNEDGTIHIVVNGEFYGYDRIMSQLRSRGHKFATKSDSEIAIHLYEEKGLRFLENLRGEFSFILWDARHGTVVAARDRFGVKPLYYTSHEGTLYIASEIKALKAMGIPMRWDREFYYHMCSTGIEMRDRTHFQGVYQLPAGHYLIASSNGLHTFQYWDLDYSRVQNHNDSQELIDEFYRLLEDAVKERLRADVKVGCYLSGGIDSSAILALMSEHSGQPVRAFSIAFEHTDYNEESLAREMARKVGADFDCVRVGSQEHADNFSAAVVHAERPVFNPHCAAKLLLSKFVRDAGYRVVLVGEGSDELLGGYVAYRNDAINFGDPSSRAEQLNQLYKDNKAAVGINLPTSADDPGGLVEGILGFVPSWFRGRKAVASRLKEVLREEFLRDFQNQDRYQVLLDGLNLVGKIDGVHPLNISLYLSSKCVLPNYQLNVTGDRMEMANSVEGRLPFLDHRLAEFIATLPVDLKIHGTADGMSEKYILREAVKTRVTNNVYKKHKHPFLSPPVSLDMTGPFHELLQDVLRGEALETIPFFDASRVRSLLDDLHASNEKDGIALDFPLTFLLSTVILGTEFAIS